MVMAGIKNRMQRLMTPGVVLAKEPGVKLVPLNKQPTSFVKAICRRRPDRDEVLSCYGSDREREVAKAAMSESSGSAGGYLVPLDYSTLLLAAVDENSFVEPRATVLPMSSLETACPTVDFTTANSAGTGPFFGGIRFVWGQSGVVGSTPNDTTLTENEPRFRQARLKACDLIGQLVVSNQYISDLSPEGEAALMALFGRAAAWYKEFAFLQGQGSSNQQPVGILNSGTLLTVSPRATSSHIAIADIASMSAKMIPFGWNHSIWACSPSCLADVLKIAGFVPNEDPLGTEQGCAGSLMSRPLFVTEKLPAMGTKGDILFFDPSLYVIGNRMDVLIEASPHPLFSSFQTVFRVWLRVAGQPLTDGIITLADGSSTASAFVALAA